MPGFRRRTAALILLCALACGCAGIGRQVDWLPSGPSFSPKKTGDVEVFFSRAQVKHPYGAMALLHGWDVKPEDKKSLDRQIQMMRELAARNGADAIIAAINDHETGQGDFSGGLPDGLCNAYAIAVKYVDTLTPQERQALQNWKP
ncbi:MAG: hypothetical protein WC421_06100 [Elusimicrobiales bacterium]